MGAEIDRLEVKIEAQATKANNVLDKLTRNLETLSNSLSRINGTGLTELANGVQRLGAAMQSINSVKTTDFTRLAKNIEKLGNINTSSLNSAASSMSRLTSAFNQLGTVSSNAEQVGELAKNIAKLGWKTSQQAADNIPRLSDALNKMMQTLSTAPRVSDNLIQMTRALAELSRQGSRVGSAGNTLLQSFNRISVSAGNTSKSIKSLAHFFGKLYANYFLIIRGSKKLWSAIKSSMNYVEVLNYFDAAFGQVAESAVSQWQQAGYDSAQAYYDSFSGRAKEVTSKMTGFTITATGTLEMSDTPSLGIDPSQVMNYQAMFGQMSSSIGVTAENSLLLSEVLTKIGADLASVKNMDFDKTWTDMASGLAGMSRTLDKYGANIRNVNLQQKLNELGINANITALNQNDKALLRTIILLDSTRYAWGDLADTINQPANQLRLLQANFTNLARTIGNMFLPVVSRVLPYINALVVAAQRLFSWVSTLLGIDISGITQGVGGGSDAMSNLLDSVDDTTSGLESAEGAARSLKKQLQGFDELNVITTPQESGSGDSGTGSVNPSLGSAFGDIASEYLQVWDEAFAAMENRTQEIANSIYNALQPIRDIISDFAVGDFFSAGQDVSNLVISINDFFARAIDNVDWYGIGQNIGDFLAGVDWLDVLNSFGNLFWQAIKGAIELWAGSFDTAPVETAIITAIAGMRIARINIPTPIRIGLTVIAFAPNIARAIGEALGIDETIFGDSIEELSWSYFFDRLREGFTNDSGELSITKGIRFTLEVLEANVTGTAELLGLTESENPIIRFLFSPTNDVLRELDVSGWIGGAVEEFEGILSGINDFISDVFSGDWESAWFDVKQISSNTWTGIGENIDERIRIIKGVVALVTDQIKEKWGEKWSEIKLKTTDIWGNIKTTVSGASDWIKIKITAFTEQIKNKWTEKWNGIKLKTIEVWNNLKTTISGATDWIKIKITAWFNRIKTFFIPSQWNFTGVRTGLESAFESAIDAVKQVWNAFANWLNGMLTWEIEPVVVMGRTIFSGATIDLGRIPTFATGGFPEDGIFMANHEELVGKFSNGKTAVANNEQITQGIAEAVYPAVYNAVMAAMSNNNANVTFQIEGDPTGMFKVVQKESKNYSQRTGRPAFDF